MTGIINCKKCKYYYVNRGEKLENSAYCDNPKWSYARAVFDSRVMLGCPDGCALVDEHEHEIEASTMRELDT